MDDIDPAIYGIAIDAMAPAMFEVFGHDVLAEALGSSFEPTGGVADGGQDGFLRAKSGKPRQYIQISKEKDVRGKVRRTLERLKESGREVDSLTFLTSENFPTRELFETEIEKDTGVQLRIHDRSWIAVQLTRSAGLRQIFRERASDGLRAAERIVSSAVQAYSHSERMSVLVYMDAHARNASSDADMLALAVDAAIYKALEGTDPDQDVFKTSAEIIATVEASFPAIKKRPGIKISERLERLSLRESKPRIRRYHSEDKYCLPYDVRNELSEENAAVRQLEFEFIESLRSRARAIEPALSQGEIEDVAGASLRALAQTFEHQGMNLAASFQDNQTFQEVKTYQFVQEAIAANRSDNQRRTVLVDVTTKVLRAVVYSGSATERSYLFQLFKLYSVEFVMRGDDRVATYFRNSIKSLRLVVGTDILLRALSESCMRPESQSTQNALKYLSKGGAQLFLSEVVLRELHTHIIAEGREFEGNYRSWYQYASIDELKECDRILIRAFFYSNKEPERHHVHARSWENFLDLLGSHEWFKDRAGQEYFASFLMNKFGCSFILEKELGEGVSPIAVAQLRDRIVQHRSTDGREKLAENDAKHALYINRYRQVHGEVVNASVYGYSTWWLMEEFQVIQAARSLNIPSRFAMHPQFLLNFAVASPALRDLNEDFKPFFPTNFGMRITDRVPRDVLRGFLKKAEEAGKLEDAVARARLRSLGDELRGHFHARD